MTSNNIKWHRRAKPAVDILAISDSRLFPDAEVFLILPRLVLLSGLWEPSHLALPRSFAMEEQQVEALRPWAFAVHVGSEP